MVCSVCFECGHNKRTCPFQLKAPNGVDLSTIPLTSERDIPTDSEMKIAKELVAILDSPTPVEVKIAKELVAILDAPTPVEMKIAKELVAILDSPTPVEVKIAKELVAILDSPTPVEVKIAKELSSLLDGEKTMRKCSLCGECGHNKRTCPIKCEHCPVQFTPSEKNVAKELISILDEPRNQELITFANGRPMSIDLGP
jgi:ferredoxin